MIQTHGNSFIQSPILIGNIKAQFSLTTSNPNSHWQHQSPILIGNIQAQFSLTTSKAQFSLALLYQKEKSPRLSTLGKKKKNHVKMLLWQKMIMAIILWRNSLRAILWIMFSYYEPMKYVDIILHHDIHNIYLLHSW